MIHTVNFNRNLSYFTPLIDYIKNNNLYNGENLIYINKYTDGTFSITNPTSEYKNCIFVNGYPHFNIPLDICLEEIKYFINCEQMYNYNFIVRYGDTHPHKPIPKLAQIRNLLIENALSSLLSNNVKSYYGLGDISIKTLNDFLSKNNINITAEELFLKIVTNNLDENLRLKFLTYNKDSILKIQNFLSQINLSQKNFLLESSLYVDQDLYRKLKNDDRYQEQLKANGELKYTLQELMFIYSIIKNENDILINIIGSNQSEHVLKVNKILKESDPNINSRFLTYGICRNAEERDVTEWVKSFDEFIVTNNLNINGRKLSAIELLKIIVIIVNNDNILDFSNLKKYLNAIKIFCNSIELNDKSMQSVNISSNNDLLCKMALVGYNLNRSIEMGESNYFYKYLLSVIKEYDSHKDRYHNMEMLYYEFIDSAFGRLGFGKNTDNVIKEGNKVLIK